MKQFATPLSIKGNKEQLKSIWPKLVDLGYKTTQTFYNWGSDNRFILTRFGSRLGEIGYNQEEDYNIATLVDASNPELVLALAAMVEEDTTYKGEYIKCIESYSNQFTNGRLYKLRKDSDGYSYSVEKDDIGQENGLTISDFCKATKEEIIEHFKQKGMGVIVSDQDDSSNRIDGIKKIIGWEIKSGMNREAVLKAIGWNKNTRLDGRYELQHNGQGYLDAVKLGILNALFEPVYKSETKTVIINSIQFVITKDKISTNNRLFTREDLTHLIAVYGGDFTCGPVGYHINSFKFGCDYQFEITLDNVRELIKEMDKL